jgi:hypothetical protein
VRQVPLLSHQDVFAKVFGVGLPAAVFIDAAVVRMVLVPATMELLSDRNWWLPGWLDRLLPSLHIEGHDVPVDDTAAPEPRRRGPGCPWVPGDHSRGRLQEVRDLVAVLVFPWAALATRGPGSPLRDLLRRAVQALCLQP